MKLFLSSFLIVKPNKNYDNLAGISPNSLLKLNKVNTSSCNSTKVFTMILKLFKPNKLFRSFLWFCLCIGITFVLSLTPINVLANSADNQAKNTLESLFSRVITDENPLYVLGGGGEFFTFKKTGKTTCGQYAMAESMVPPGSGPPPHIHHHANEWFYFPDGGIMLMHGSNIFATMKDIPGVTAPKERLHLEVTKPGSFYYSHKQHLHGYVNNSTEPKRLISVWSNDEDKVGISSYFSAISPKVVDTSKPPIMTGPNRELYVTQGPKYEINQSAHFWEYVDSVDYNFPKTDPHLDELQALLAPDIEGGKPRICK